MITSPIFTLPMMFHRSHRNNPATNIFGANRLRSPVSDIDVLAAAVNCGLISLEDAKKSIGELDPITCVKIDEMFSCDEGREALAKAMTEPYRNDNTQDYCI